MPNRFSPNFPGPPGLAGRFVVLEGGDGAGKSTQLALLAERLVAEGLVNAPGRPQLVLTREPGGTELGDQIRDMLLHQGEVAAPAEALLYAADRAQHVAALIRPALEAGALVVSDRYVDSSIAYQSEGRDLPSAAVEAINAFGTGGLVPDLTILLDIDQAAATHRREQAGVPADRLESAGSRFHQRVRRRYLELAAASPDRYAVVDAAAAPPVVHQEIWAAVCLLTGAATDALGAAPPTGGER